MTKKKYIVYTLMFLILIVAHYFIRAGFGDDRAYMEVWERGTDLIAFLGERYHGWSSRLVIEFLMMYLVKTPLIVWKALDIIIVMLLVWNTGDLFAVRKESVLTAQIAFFAVMWLQPMVDLASAGWITTTTNYLWALSFGMMALRPLKHEICGEKQKTWEMVLCPLFVLYSANMEQMCAILFGAYALIGTYQIAVKRQKLSGFSILQFVLILASLLFILTAPGNRIRSEEEAARFFPEFLEMGLFQKLHMIFIENSHLYISGGYEKYCHVFLPFAILLFLCAVAAKNWDSEKDPGLKRRKIRRATGCLVAGIPLLVHIFCVYVFPFLLYEINFPRFRRPMAVLAENRNIPGQSGFSDGLILIQTLVYLMVHICVCLTIYFIHGKSRETLLQLVILLAGFLSRMIIGFSPTIYASGGRTAIFCSMSLFIIMIRNLQFYLDILRMGRAERLRI